MKKPDPTLSYLMRLRLPDLPLLRYAETICSVRNYLARQREWHHIRSFDLISFELGDFLYCTGVRWIDREGKDHEYVFHPA